MLRTAQQKLTILLLEVSVVTALRAGEIENTLKKHGTGEVRSNDGRVAEKGWRVYSCVPAPFVATGMAN